MILVSLLLLLCFYLCVCVICFSNNVLDLKKALMYALETIMHRNITCMFESSLTLALF